MDQETMVPDLIGLTYEEAKAQLELLGINVAGVIGNGLIIDTASAFIYKQNPQPMDEDKRPLFIRSGQLMDLYISSVKILPEDSVQTNFK
jgi:hypothetical protein